MRRRRASSIMWRGVRLRKRSNINIPKSNTFPLYSTPLASSLTSLLTLRIAGHILFCCALAFFGPRHVTIN
jgi:hypothetical protein